MERADLDALLEAAYRTPNAGNRQGTRIVVSKDRALNERLGRAQNVIYEKFNARQPLSLSDGEIASTSRSGFYNAPTVIYLFAPNQFLFAEPDSYIKAFSLCLAAAERDIDSCIISVAADYFIDDFGKSVLKAWNIPKPITSVPMSSWDTAEGKTLSKRHGGMKHRFLWRKGGKILLGAKIAPIRCSYVPSLLERRFF